jgi:NADH-quinone oxidoreductase subunit A
MPPSETQSYAVNEYWPILAMAGFGVLFAAGSMFISHLLGERGRQNKTKNTPYECGMPIKTEAHSRFSVKFYLVAMLFILFDVEVVFMYPWAASYGADRGGAGPDTALLLWEAAIFTAVLLAGLVYVLKKGVLEWQKAD